MPTRHESRSMALRRCALLLALALPCGGPGRAQPAPATRWPNGPPTTPSYFPIGVWLQNTARAAEYKAIGVNLYVGLWAGPTAAQIGQLRAAGMQAVAAQTPDGLAGGDGVIVGWMQDDEPDNAQPNGARGFGAPTEPAEIVARYRRMKAADPSRPVFLNFGRGAAWDGWYGRKNRMGHPEDYAEYARGADIVGFDIYPAASSGPIQDQFWRVPWGVDRLRAAAGPQRAVWAVIETGPIAGALGATPAQVRAETWAAIAHGARGIVYFVHQFAPVKTDHRLLEDGPMKASIAETNREIAALAPVLNAPDAPPRLRVRTAPEAARLDILERRVDGALTLVAVNLRPEETAATIELDGPGASALEVIGEGRVISLERGGFADVFAPFAVHIYRLPLQP